jgi:hypothetical protein
VAFLTPRLMSRAYRRMLPDLPPSRSRSAPTVSCRVGPPLHARATTQVYERLLLDRVRGLFTASSNSTFLLARHKLFRPLKRIGNSGETQGLCQGETSCCASSGDPPVCPARCRWNGTAWCSTRSRRSALEGRAQASPNLGKRLRGQQSASPTRRGVIPLAAELGVRHVN